MNSSLIFLIISSLLFLLGLALTAWIHNQYHLDIVVLPAPPPPDPVLPLISVIIPARNEERNIRACVAALLVQTYPHLEVIVVDDRSTDRTPQILAEIQASSGREDQPTRTPRLVVISGAELPPGWAGKPHAAHQGAAVARGEWLCFVDADTFASPHLIASTYRSAEEGRADLFTIMTAQNLAGFWEKVIMPVVFTALSFGFPARRVNDPGKPDAIANGQFILVRRAVYDAVGGHQAVRERIDEDRALAERVKGAGFRLVIADGRALATTRMYTSFPEIWEGWTKNIFLGLRDRLWLLLAGALTGLLAALALPFWLVAGIAWLVTGGGALAALVAGQAVVLWAVLLYYRYRAARAFGLSGLYALTLPLGALVFTGMMLASTFKVISGRGVTWKGRTYS
jgi:chlorobactene glucosyltransferase